MISLKCIRLSDGKECDFPSPTVVALGNFDGIHLGHQVLLSETVALAKKTGAVSTAFCFDPPSSDFLFPGSLPQHLSTWDQKRRKFAEAGIEYGLIADFPSLRNFSAEDFIRKILQEKCHAIGTVCGFNFRFGKDGKGNSIDLQNYFSDSVIVPPFTLNGEIVSSTLIRNLLLSGKTKQANQYLGYAFSFSSVVEKGKQIGRTIGFPTINQHFPDQLLIPKFGVYETLCTVDGKVYRGISNVGVRPTVDALDRVNCETYLTDFSGDLYGKIVTISFLHYLRNEQKFGSLSELQNQIGKDIQSLL